MKTENKSHKNHTVLVTGGAGFIGSHLVEALMRRGEEVHVLDNLSGGSLKNIQQWLTNPRLKFFNGDLLNKADVEKAVKGCHTVFHLAANPEVRLSSTAPDIHFRQNVEATFNLLEAVRRLGDTEAFVFTSTSTVYGDVAKIPTPEDAPLRPISVYGASKMASEALINAYACSYGFRGIIYRLANVIGSRSGHGVIYDFIQKLKANPCELEILGDGTQSKSYLYVDDCVEAMLLGFEDSSGRTEVFNLGSDDRTDVKTIAKTVVEEMGLRNVVFSFTGGVDGGRGWIGDVKYMLLDTHKMKALGWKPKFSSNQAVSASVRSILKGNPSRV